MRNGIVISAAFLSAFTTARADGVKICFEAETAELIEAPVVLVTNGIEGASGAYLEIPEGAGNPPKVESGKAVFSFETAADGNFILWCRVWWEDECGNSFTVQIDNQPAFLFGEDATYKVWQWVKYPVARTTKPLRLSKGQHTLTVRNREDGVRLDQVLLSADRRFVPVDIEMPGLRK